MALPPPTLLLFALLACDGGPPAPVGSAAPPAERVGLDSGPAPVTPWSHPLATPEARALLLGLIESGAARDMAELPCAPRGGQHHR